MKCLSIEEVSLWIRRTGQIENPYTGEMQPEFCVQFHAPQNYPAKECFVRAFLNAVVCDGDVLVVVTDSEPSEECQRFIHEAVRTSVGENRTVAEAPGYVVLHSQWEQAIALFSLMSCFRWKCYLYGSTDQITLYNWEGEIFDAWTSSESKATEIRRIIRLFELKETES